jgi:resuscitation-promoting factor RpfA
VGRHSRGRGRHRAPSQTGRVTARVAAASAVLVGPFVATDPAQAGPPGGWEPIVSCESGGRNVPNAVSSASGYYQIIDGTWADYGGKEYAPRAIHASREEQTVVAERIFADRGLQPWDSSRPCWAGKVGKHASNDAAPPHTARLATTPRHARPTSYTVQPDDTLGSIAKARGMSWRALFEANRGVVENPDLIYPGEHLRV